LNRAAPTRADLRRFCDLDGWDEVRSPHGRIGNYRRYEKVLADGTILQTRLSPGRRQLSPGLWQRIWKHQLGLASPDQFWQVLRERRPAVRPGDRSVAMPPGQVAGVGEPEIGG
jgi:hypothetical protein